MKTTDFDTLMTGAREALAHAKGEPTAARARVIDVDKLDVSSIREKVRLSQGRFAATFGINLSTLRNWEQGRVKPQGPARVLLTVIDRDPEAVLRALHVGSPKKATTRGRQRAA